MMADLGEPLKVKSYQVRATDDGFVRVAIIGADGCELVAATMEVDDALSIADAIKIVVNRMSR
jgi:hypothetical protein